MFSKGSTVQVNGVTATVVERIEKFVRGWVSYDYRVQFANGTQATVTQDALF